MRTKNYVLSLFALLTLTIYTTFANHAYSSILEDCNIEITDVNVECDGDDLFVQINAEYADVGNEGFSVNGNGNDYGDFDYEDLPITIGPLTADGSIPIEFVLSDNQIDNCNDFVVLGAIDCTDGCSIWDLTVDFLECTSDSTYKVKIDFLHVNTGGIGFDLSANGSFFGFYTYADLPLIIPDYPVSGNDNDNILICDNDSNCCEDLSWSSPDCTTTNDCHIWDLVVEAHDCDDNGQFLVDLDFNFESVGDEGFTVKANGDVLGSFDYDSLFITLGPFDDNTLYHFVVFDNQFDGCAAEFDLNAFNCDGDCEIGEILTDITDCDDEGEFYVWIDFDYSNVGSNGFSVLGNGNNYGLFSYVDLPVQIGPFDGNGTSVYEIIVKDNDFPDCSNFAVITALNCNGGICELWDLIVEVFDCTSDSTYKIKVDFNHANTSGDHFDLWANGDFFGSYAYANLPQTITDFPISGNNVDWVKVCDNDNPDCCAEYEFDVPDCALAGDCHIWDLVVEAYDCDDNGQFLVDLDFNFVNVGNEGFTVKVNGDVLGTFDYDSLYLTLGPFDDNILYHFVVFDNQFGDCAAEFDLTAFDCDGGICELWDLEVDVFDCTSDSTYKIIVNFNHANTSGDHFDLWANGDYFGFFAYADLPLTITDFPISGNHVDWIKVCDNDNPDCCKSTEFEVPDCALPAECHIWDIELEPLDCNDNGFFNVLVDFEFDNVGNDGFSIVGNGNNYGSFSYDSLPVQIGSFQGNGINSYELVVYDNQFEDCEEEYIIEPLLCDDQGNSPIITPFINIVDKEFITIEVNHGFGGLSGIIIYGIDGQIRFNEQYPENPRKVQIRHHQIADGLMIMNVQVDGRWEQQKIVIFK